MYYLVMANVFGTNSGYKAARYIELSCGDCLLRIEGFVHDTGGWDGFVAVEVISNHTGIWHMRFLTRIKNAWKVLRGNYRWSGFELFTREEAEAFIGAVKEMNQEAFPT